MCAGPNLAVFCSYLISCAPGMFFRHLLNDFAMFPFAPLVSGTTFILHFAYAVYPFWCLYILVSSNLFLDHISVS